MPPPPSVNGGGNNKPSAAATTTIWTSISRATWPILSALVIFAFILGGRMETPAEKQLRIDRSLLPVINRLESLTHRVETIDANDQEHILETGHREMELRMFAVESRMNSVDAVEREETEILRELMETKKEERELFEVLVETKKEERKILHEIKEVIREHIGGKGIMIPLGL